MELNKSILRKLPYFNKSTLAEAIGQTGENLNYWVKKYLQRGDLMALKKGLYVTGLYLLTLERNANLRETYLEYLANTIRYPSYLSLEYVLSKYGLIPEGVYSFTSITLKSPRVYKNVLGNFIYRNIKESLFCGFEEREFEGNRIKIASKAKALFDYLYFKRESSLDDLRINWEVLTPKDKEEFATFVKISNSAKMKMVLKKLKW
jgi:hypothetical protein